MNGYLVTSSFNDESTGWVWNLAKSRTSNTNYNTALASFTTQPWVTDANNMTSDIFGTALASDIWNNEASIINVFKAGYADTIDIIEDSLKGKDNSTNLAVNESDGILRDNSPDADGIHTGKIVTTTDALLDSISQQTTSMTSGTYANLQTTCENGNAISSGTGATVTITGDGTVTSVTIQDQGSGYEIGNILTVSQTDISGSTSDLKFTLTQNDLEQNPSQAQSNIPQFLSENIIQKDYLRLLDATNNISLSDTNGQSIPLLPGDNIIVEFKVAFFYKNPLHSANSNINHFLNDYSYSTSTDKKYLVIHLS